MQSTLSLESSTKSEYLTKLLAITDNQTFISHVLDHYFLQNLNEYLKGNEQVQLQELNEKILQLSDQYRTSTENYLDLIETLFSIFLRDNMSGPSVYTLYVEETKAPLIKGGPLPDTLLDPLSNKNQALQDLLLQHFEKDSEQIYLKTQFLVLFYAIEILLTNIHTSIEHPQFKLWKARYFYLHDQQLTSSVAHLKDNSIKLYEEYLQYFLEQYEANKSQTMKNTYVQLLIEQSYCYLNFYKYKKCKKCIKDAMKILNLNLTLTGRLGRRTKYQEFDIAQLVLDIDNRDVQIIESKPEVVSADGEETKQQKVLLEEDTILYEEPKITDPQGELTKKELSVEDQLVILAYVNYVTKTHPKDETRMELLRPYINACTEKSNNWLVFSFALLHRSRNELDRTKTMERALLQIQTLIDQFRDKEPNTGVRLANYFSTDYPLHWQMQKELAKYYMKIGVYVSAYEMLREVELYEDCILSMFMAGRSKLAEELAEERLEKSKLAQPNILCLLGDIKKDVSYYQRAWEVSGHKSARAMRSLARIQYFQGEFKKSAECYEKALSISRLYPDAWFTLGCAYMRLEELKQAVYAFGVSISIDESNCEAWSNISTCQMRMEKYKEAVMCLEQALKHNRKNWKIWENYIILSIETLKFYKAVSASRELMRMDMTDRLNVGLMLKICDVFLKNYVAKAGTPFEEFNIAKKQLYAFFDDYTEKVAKDWQVWRLICRIKSILKESHENIKSIKLKEIRALQNINWENDMQVYLFQYVLVILVKRQREV
ncbi:tetratricopeptide repeat protein 27 [Stylonychia lemnae]|uniref:Tetratricopeptide repeat protein 27 n=1 Tax=Stylonychia lemnae TaxID=5949 RepID=A0A078AY09_STYLE|nr:tetratricopeptide repeat protein 27 [Stylonychia lemnae]|eukprot:CDW87054.1 tetratricopeptide repeat protein 27 [Stylonychia lemnae]